MKHSPFPPCVPTPPVDAIKELAGSHPAMDNRLAEWLSAQEQLAMWEAEEQKVTDFIDAVGNASDGLGELDRDALRALYERTTGVRASGFTKVLADGSTLPDGSGRTDHIVLLDHATGLMWCVKSIGDPAGDPMSQADCEKACRELRILGHDDWCLPTRAELAALIDDTRHEPAIDTSLFPGVKPRWHWTSTLCACSASSTWRVDFHLGYVDHYRRDYNGFALAVRRAGKQVQKEQAE